MADFSKAFTIGRVTTFSGTSVTSLEQKSDKLSCRVETDINNAGTPLSLLWQSGHNKY
jgi:hypothetical protein